MSDGAAAVLMMRRSIAKRLGLKVLGVVRGFKVVGVQPDEMGIGPAVAIPAALQNAGLFSIKKTQKCQVNILYNSSYSW